MKRIIAMFLLLFLIGCEEEKPGQEYLLALATGGNARFSPPETTCQAGSTWEVSSNVRGSWTSYDAVGNVVVAVSLLNARIGRSTDSGRTWTAITPPPAVSLISWTKVLYGNGLFIAVSEFTNSVIVSGDLGLTWTVVDLTFNNKLSAGVFDGSKFIFAGRDSFIYETVNGVSWTRRAISFPIYDMEYGNGIYVAVTYSDGRIATSTDTMTWTQIAYTVPTQSAYALNFAGEKFFHVSSGGAVKTLITSTNGVNWTDVSNPSEDISSVVYDGNNYIAGGYNGTIFKSANGSTWTNTGHSISGYVRTMGSVKGNYFALGDDERGFSLCQ